MKYNPVSRRMFLQGLGGVSLAVPFMSSLLPRQALAQAQTPPVGLNLRYITLYNPHGGIWNQHIYPDTQAFMLDPQGFDHGSVASQGPTTQYGNNAFNTNDRVGYNIHAGPMSNFVHSLNTGGSGFSEMIDGQFNSYLQHITVLRGLDTTNYAGHHWGKACFGQLGQNDGMPMVQEISNASTSMLCAYSPRFYAATPMQRHVELSIGTYMGGTHFLQNASNGTVQSVGNGFFPSWLSRFNQLVQTREVQGVGGTTNPRIIRPVDVINSIMEDLTAQMSRASRDDRLELERYMDGINSVATNPNLLNVSFGTGEDYIPGTETGLECGSNPAVPLDNQPVGYNHNGSTVSRDVHQIQGGIAEVRRTMSDMAQLTLALVKCGVTRQVNIGVEPIVSDVYTVGNASVNVNRNDTHQDIYHRYGGTLGFNPVQRQRVMVGAYRDIAQTIFRELIEGLDVPDPHNNNGGTYLYNSLVHWSMENSGTHHTYSMPTVLAGHAGGRIVAGQYIDYRRRTSTSISNTIIGAGWEQRDEQDQPIILGVPINRFWISVLRAMGLHGHEFIRSYRSRNNDTAFNGSGPDSNNANNTSFTTYGAIFQHVQRPYHLENLTRALPLLHPSNININADV